MDDSAVMDEIDRLEAENVTLSETIESLRESMRYCEREAKKEKHDWEREERLRANADRYGEKIENAKLTRYQNRQRILALKKQLRAGQASAETRTIGTVKWFSAEKGFGFITTSDGVDVFVPRASLRESDRVETGEKVSFKRIRTEKGFKAVDVRYVAE